MRSGSISEKLQKVPFGSSKDWSAAGRFKDGGAGASSDSQLIKYKLDEMLGKGSYGEVYAAMNTATGKWFAVKQVKIVARSELADEQITALEREILLLKTLEHPNIVQYLGCQRSNRKLNIFLELITGGTITQVIRKFEGGFDEALTRRYTYQLLSGLNYLHSHRILHLDVKGSNLLLDPESDSVKLADFGCARVIRNDMMDAADGEGILADFRSGSVFNTTMGTPQFMAPEVDPNPNRNPKT